MAKKVYAYLLETTKECGIVHSWDECKEIVTGKKARYKSFSSEIEAKKWLDDGANYEKKAQIKKEMQKNLPKGIYFDAGTGRGIGVESRVTDELGNSLIDLNTLGYEKNQYGNIFLGKEKTNNYGELLGLYVAIDIAQKKGVYQIFGDSNLVLHFWSKGRYNGENLSEETIYLIEKVKKSREDFEKIGGKIDYISGDYNPADLGFHK